VADVLDIENVPKQAKSGLLFQETVRRDFDALKATIKSGGNLDGSPRCVASTLLV
jgi:hypothetical protein